MSEITINQTPTQLLETAYQYLPPVSKFLRNVLFKEDKTFNTKTFAVDIINRGTLSKPKYIKNELEDIEGDTSNITTKTKIFEGKMFKLRKTFEVTSDNFLRVPGKTEYNTTIQDYILFQIGQNLKFLLLSFEQSFEKACWDILLSKNFEDTVYDIPATCYVQENWTDVNFNLEKSIADKSILMQKNTINRLIPNILVLGRKRAQDFFLLEQVKSYQDIRRVDLSLTKLGKAFQFQSKNSLNGFNNLLYRGSFLNLEVYEYIGTDSDGNLYLPENKAILLNTNGINFFAWCPVVYPNTQLNSSIPNIVTGITSPNGYITKLDTKPILNIWTHQYKPIITIELTAHYIPVLVDYPFVIIENPTT